MLKTVGLNLKFQERNNTSYIIKKSNVYCPSEFVEDHAQKFVGKNIFHFDIIQILKPFQALSLYKNETTFFIQIQRLLFTSPFHSEQSNAPK
jgi:hypothetical protein